MAWIAIRDALLLIALVPFAFCLFAIFAAHRFFDSSSSLNTRAGFKTPFSPLKIKDLARPKVGFEIASSQLACPEAAKAAEGSLVSLAVSILRPIYGLDRDAYENFASFCRQDYPEFEMLFCVSDESDPAIPIIRKLVADFPQRPLRLLIGSEPLGVSDKVNKLCRMAKEARHDVLIVCDSDVRVEPGFLAAVAAPFVKSAAATMAESAAAQGGAEENVGGVTCLYRGLTDGSFAADLEALGNSTDFAAGVLVARELSGVNFMLGAVMATTKACLAEIGGFEALVNYFADDYELGNRIARAGHFIELSRFPVSIVYPRENFAGAFRHQTRWFASILHSRPWGHVGMIFSQPLPWTILAAIIAPAAWVSAAFVADYLLFRVLMAWAVGVAGMRDDLVRRKWWLLPVRDAFAFAAWLASFLPRSITWRGQQFYVRNRLLVPAKRP